jgi:hypothetical protein
MRCVAERWLNYPSIANPRGAVGQMCRYAGLRSSHQCSTSDSRARICIASVLLNKDHVDAHATAERALQVFGPASSML